MGKRMVMLLGVMLMIAASVAEAQEYYTIEQVKEQAAAGWHETYEAYGREIVVDVEAYIPDVDRVPVERLEFARMEPLVTEEETGLKFVVYPELNVFGYQTPVFLEETPGKIEQINGEGMGYPNEWDRVYPLGSTVTLKEAVDILRKALATMHLDESNWDLAQPYELSTVGFRHPKTKELVAPGMYRLYFHQKVNGIPLLNHAGATYQRKTRGNATIRLTGLIISSEMYDVIIDMLKPIEQVAEDVPLCSFSTVVEAFEKEIEEGHIRKVYDLEFGYLFYEDPEYVSSDTWTDHFYAVPVWQLNCLYVSNRQEELPEYGLDETGDERYSLEYSSLIVNAQTGELQDFMSTKADRAQYKGFISWESVQ